MGDNGMMVLYIYIYFLNFPLSFKIYTEIFMSEISGCLIFVQIN